MTKLERLERAVVDALADYADAAAFLSAAFDDARAAAYTGTTDYDVAYTIAYDAHCAADDACDAYIRAKKELSNYKKEQDDE